MLRFFARFKGLHKAIFLAFCAVLLIGLIVSYSIPNSNLSRLRGGGNPADAMVVAKVGSREVTLKDFRQQIEALASTFTRGNTLPLATIKALGLDKQALDRLVEDRLALAEADRLKISATDDEVSEQIRTLPGFSDPETGKFIGKEEYKRIMMLREQRGEGTLEEFEEGIRRSIISGKIRDYLGVAAQVSDKEIEEEFKKDNTTVDLVYAQIDNSKVKDKLKLTDDELKKYYDEHQAEFKVADAVRKVEYVFVPTDLATKTAPLKEEDLKKEYEERKQFEPRVSVIKLNVLTPTDENTVKAKIDELNVRVRGTDTQKAEDFATVARGNSQDPSRDKGGDIGFVKKDPNKSGAWQQRAFNLKVGDIDGPFRDGTSWYIIKVTEQRQIPFNEMRPTLEASLKNRQGYIRASQLADKVYEKFTETKDIKQAAEVAAKELNVKPETLIRNIPFFKKGDTLPEIGSNPQFEGAVEPLKKGEIADKVGVPNGLAVPRLVDLKEPGQQLTFEDAKFLVEQKLRSIREPDMARQKAQEIISEAKTAADLEGLFKKEGLEVKKDTNFNGFSFSSMQLVQQAKTAALALKEGEVSKTPIKVGASWMVFGATKRKDPDMARLATDREGIRQRLLGDAQNMAFDTYVKASRKRYEADGKLTIYQDRIDKFLNSSPTAPEK
ncbi:MAG TPA: peptidyl-prolyl cis-trans isomerase [Blastocatellia bacterium]|nr:peptidyl-prolyl cis-trans isomerase [Blastocatellia bacterium]